MTVDWAYPGALLTGAALSVSGAVLQSVLRNPLAEPYLLGTVGGGALLAALATNLGLTAIGAWVLPASSFLGSCLSLAMVCTIAYFSSRARTREGGDAYLRSSGSTMVLAGFVTGGFTGSLNMLVMSFAKEEDFVRISKWLYGSLVSVRGDTLAIALVVFACGFAALMALATRLNVMELGRDEAETLGVDTRTTMFLVLAIVSLMTSVSVALAGAVGFIGLVVPHYVRRRTGPRMQRLLPISALAGGVFLMAMECLRRAIPHDIPAGVVCAVIGAPFFFWLLLSRHNGEGWDV